MIVTIDGPAGSGKSTAAKGLAERLQFQFLDTGAMYRVVALACLERSIDIHDAAAVLDAAHAVKITFEGERVFANGVDVSEAIRTADVTQASSLVAMNPGVREEMVKQQRRIAQGRNIVCEGRDQGTVVFPHAECKFYLTADARQRAYRRQREMQGESNDASLEEILAQIIDRDQRDKNRDVSPLKAADDALRIDTSEYTPTQVLDLLEETVRLRMARD